MVAVAGVGLVVVVRVGVNVGVVVSAAWAKNGQWAWAWVANLLWKVPAARGHLALARGQVSGSPRWSDEGKSVRRVPGPWQQ